MASLTLPLDNIDVGENTEQISKLFPKCRPRSDINLNKLCGIGTRKENLDNPTDTVMNMHIERDRWTANNVTKENSQLAKDDEQRASTGTYRLRDSRIIEIAGGREIYSQSRSKAIRKSKSSQFLGDEEIKLEKSPIKHDVWTMKGKNNEIIKVKHFQDYAETILSSDIHSMIHEKKDQTIEENPVKSTGLTKACTDEIVVFDDSDVWKREKIAFKSNEMEQNDFEAARSCNLKRENTEKVAKVIGSLPIAVYEGSPRRYGVKSASNNLHVQLPSAQSLLVSPGIYPRRPGFPQRIVSSQSFTEYENDIQCKRASPPILLSSKITDPITTTLTTTTSNSTNTTTSAFDYLYEFSETRKVLEEFFKGPPDEDKKLETEFQDLEYELKRQDPEYTEYENNFLDLSVGTGSSGDLGETEVGLQVGHSRNFTLSPETTDCDSNCGDLDSEVSLMLLESDMISTGGFLGSNADLTIPNDSLRVYSSMPVLEDGLSSGHASDTENNNPTVMLMKRQITEIEREISQAKTQSIIKIEEDGVSSEIEISVSPIEKKKKEQLITYLQSGSVEKTPPPPAPVSHRIITGEEKANEIEAAIKDIHLTLQRTKTLPTRHDTEEECEENLGSPVWVPSHFRQRRLSSTSVNSEKKAASVPDEEENDTDLETDRLLGQQRTDDQGFFDEKDWSKPKSRTLVAQIGQSNTKQMLTSLNECSLILPLVPPRTSKSQSPTTVSKKSESPQSQKGSLSSNKSAKEKEKNKGRSKEDIIQRSVLIEGVLFRARYLGSTQLVCEGQPTKTTRMMQAEEAVSRIKAPDGENQPSTEVDLFISTEKIMVLNTDLKEIMMDHALRTISYIADIGDLVVLMARRRFVPNEVEDAPKINRTPKMICHVFESEEAQFIAQSIGQAFQVAYMEFLKANGIEDHSFVKEMDYQEVLNSQEIFGDELQMFAKKEMQKEVVVPKSKGEILGVVIVESGWGSMLPTVVIANLAPSGAAARCGQLNIGDQIIAINGISLVGLPLSTCQNYIKNSKNQTVVKLTVVPCAPVVEVKIKRPDTKYQLGFSVQNGVICSLLRGGIAERGGVRVGHRIIEINNQSVVAVPHEKIVNLLATSVGEVNGRGNREEIDEIKMHILIVQSIVPN